MVTSRERAVAETRSANPGMEPMSRHSPEGYLIFCLGTEEYGVATLKVHEIVGRAPITPIPGAAAAVRGLINLRGKLVPVFDLRLKLGMTPSEPTPETCIIVVGISGMEAGLLVDRVNEVLRYAREEISEPPPLLGTFPANAVLGIGKSRGRIQILLDIDSVLSAQELDEANRTQPRTGPSRPEGSTRIFGKGADVAGEIQQGEEGDENT